MRNIRLFHRRVRACLLTNLIVAGSVVGCGSDGPVREYAQVTGKLSYNGKALDKGTVTFQPESGAPVVADIKPDGTYSMMGVVGPNTVMVVNRMPDPGPLEPSAGRKRMEAAKAAMEAAKTVVPSQYSTPASPLKYDVKKTATNTADFDIK